MMMMGVIGAENGWRVNFAQRVVIPIHPDAMAPGDFPGGIERSLEVPSSFHRLERYGTKRAAKECSTVKRLWIPAAP
jgi:hypothetical protein